MIRGTFMALGIVTLVISMASAGQAQPPKPSRSEAGVTLSGESLRGIRGRTVQQDYRIFLNETVPASRQTSGTMSTSAPSDSQGVRLPNGMDLNVNVGSLQNDKNPTPYQETVRRNEQNDGVKVQVELGQ